MFEKTKARIRKLEETNYTFRKVSYHLQENKQSYLVGASCFTVGYLFRKPTVVNVTNHVAPLINNAPNLAAGPQLESVSDFVLPKHVLAQIQRQGSSLIDQGNGVILHLIEERPPLPPGAQS
jgi:hypothetical protein